MNNALFSWDSANIYHIAEHDVTPDEAEEALLGDPMDIAFEAELQAGRRWAFLGNTRQGRPLLIVIALRGRRLRVVTAYDPPAQGKLLLLARKADSHE
ncbi:MAG: BrnT family toxin [Terracidiphilus sp.]|jgi:uncharacterized DUF497 family protein